MLFIKICLVKARLAKKEGERSSLQWFTPQIVYTVSLGGGGQIKDSTLTRSQPWMAERPSTWVILCCLHRHISRKIRQK